MKIKETTLSELSRLFRKTAKTYLDKKDLKGVWRAEEMALQSLDGLTCGPGDPLALHSLATAHTLAEMKVDKAGLEAALLLAAFERGRLTSENITQEPCFSPKTESLVECTAKISQFNFKRGSITRAESFRKLILTLAKDVRVILIKLADRLNVMRSLHDLTKEKQQAVARETMDIYAPLANRLGIHRMKSELEDLFFRFTDPEQYLKIRSFVAHKKNERDSYITTVKNELKEILKDNELPSTISGRFKHFWSIQKKLLRRGIDFHELYDITAFRIIVDTIPQCYQVLGLVHGKWRPIPDTFDDYIAVPKPNGYQSLHTAVIGPKGERIEIQIRTRQMHEIAENGVAAHWRYKETDKAGFNEEAIKRFGWLHDAIAGGKKEFDERILDSLRTDLFEDEVFVFTPGGDVRELRKGATPLDFAFAVHTEVGKTCVGAKVNGRIAQLNTPLNNGDTVEIITHPRGRPSPDWLDIVQTGRARQKIRHYLGETERQRNRRTGRELLEKVLKMKGVSISKFLKDESRVARALEKIKVRNIEELYLEIGRKTVDLSEVVAVFAPDSIPEPMTTGFEDVLQRPLTDFRSARRKSGVVVAGLDDIEVRFARCCRPVVGDDIIGYITRGRGVTVHRRNCRRIPSGQTERMVDAEWAMAGHETMPVRIRVTTEDRPGILSNISEIFKKYEINVVSLTVDTKDGFGILHFIVQVHSVNELKQVTRAVSSTKGVFEVSRVADAIAR